MRHIDTILTGLIYFSACYPERSKKVAYLASFTVGGILMLSTSILIHSLIFKP